MKSINKDIIDIKEYFLPFEGEKHLGTILLLPYRKDVWYKQALPAINNFKKLIEIISKYEIVFLFIDPRIDYKIVREFEMDNVIIYRVPYDDSWARDTAPIFLKHKEKEELVGLDFNFNAYGGDYNGLYFPYDNDRELAKNILLELAIKRCNKRNMVLEGGSICSNGKGILLTTSECLLSIGRNPNMSKEEIEKELISSFNLEKVLFLPNGVIDDETSGHVDNIACFLDENTILLNYEDDINNPQHLKDEENYNYLINQTNKNGDKFNIIKACYPKKMYMTSEDIIDLEINEHSKNRLINSPLAGSYLNLYQSDKYVIVPQFNDENDSKIISILNNFFKGKKDIIPLYSKDILLGGGNIHCVTMQIPNCEGMDYLLEARLNEN